MKEHEWEVTSRGKKSRRAKVRVCVSCGIKQFRSKGTAWSYLIIDCEEFSDVHDCGIVMMKKALE